MNNIIFFTKYLFFKKKTVFKLSVDRFSDRVQSRAAASSHSKAVRRRWPSASARSISATAAAALHSGQIWMCTCRSCSIFHDTILSTTPPRATAVVLISGGFSSSTDFELPNSVVLVLMLQAPLRVFSSAVAQLCSQLYATFCCSKRNHQTQF